MNKEHYRLLMAEYEAQRMKNAALEDARLDEIRENAPDVAALVDKRHQMILGGIQKIFENGKDADVEQVMHASAKPWSARATTRTTCSRSTAVPSAATRALSATASAPNASALSSAFAKWTSRTTAARALNGLIPPSFRPILCRARK